MLSKTEFLKAKTESGSFGEEQQELVSNLQDHLDADLKTEAWTENLSQHWIQKTTHATASHDTSDGNSCFA